MFRKPIINTVVQMVGKGLTVVFGLIVTAILIRKLGTDNYGVYILIGSCFIFLDSLADFGTKIIGVRKLAASKRKKKLVWRDVFWLRVVMTGVAFVAGLGLALMWPGLRAVRVEAVIVLMMIWLTMVAGSLEIVWQWRLAMDKKVIVDILFSGLFLGLVWMRRNDLTLLWVYVLVLAARGLSLGVGIKLFLKIWKFDWRKFFEIRWGRVRKMLIECWPMGVYLLVFTSYDRAVDSLMIDRMLGLGAVAWYGLAYKIYAVAIQPAYFFTASVFPLMPKKSGGQKLIVRSAGILGLGLVVLVPTIYILAPWMVGVLAGNGFGASVIVLRILLIALVFSYFNHLVGFSLISQGGQKQMLGLGLIALTFNLVANILVIPTYGVVGAAVVTAATEGLSLVLVVTKHSAKWSVSPS